MLRTTAVPEHRIAKFLKANKGLDFCHECLAAEFEMSVRQVREAAAVLKAPEFERRQSLCSSCLKIRPVIGCPIT